MKQKTKKKNKTSFWKFAAVFAAIVVLTLINNLVRKKVVVLQVPGNPGVSGLETVDDNLICVFQDGRIVTWNWDSNTQKADFKVTSDRAVLLNSQRIAAVNTSGKKMLTVYQLPSGQKQKDFSVGWEDQEVWLRISPDKNSVVLIRRNSPDSTGNVLYEFLAVNIEKEFLGTPTTFSIPQDQAQFIDYAVDNDSRLIAVGSQKDSGHIAAVDLRNGSLLWNIGYPDTKEFCSVMTSPDNTTLYAGNRDGILYKLDIQTGVIIQKIILLEPGEKRPITNDYSVLNLAFSPDGQYYVATINPKAYILKSETDNMIHIFSPANKLVSKIAFSPDNKFVATSDIRAGYPVKIWPLPEEN